MADDLTPEQVKAFRLADNKTSEFAEWGMDKLQIELEGIVTEDEHNLIRSKLDQYLDANGVSYGFVGWLVNGQLCRH